MKTINKAELEAIKARGGKVLVREQGKREQPKPEPVRAPEKAAPSEVVIPVGFLKEMRQIAMQTAQAAEAAAQVASVMSMRDPGIETMLQKLSEVRALGHDTSDIEIDVIRNNQGFIDKLKIKRS